MTQGIIITIPGVDAGGTALSPTDYILNTDYPLLKVATEGEGTFTLGVGTSVGTATVTHNLGYRPHAWFYSDYIQSGSVTQYRTRNNELNTGTASVEIVFNDSTGTASPRSIGYHYQIFYDKVESI